MVLTAEKLKEGEQLADTNFFVADPDTGKGLYAHYHQSASLENDFGWFCARRFDDVKKRRREEALNVAGKMTNKESARIKKEYSGWLMIEQILKPKNFYENIKALQRISTFEGRFVTFEAKKSLLQPLTQQAKRVTLRLAFASTADADEIAETIEKAAEQEMLKRAIVTGKDAGDRPRTYKLIKDAQVFDELDHEEFVKDLVVKFDDWSGSIKNSEIVKRLSEVAKRTSVKALLV
jgi:hypothetical protein